MALIGKVRTYLRETIDSRDLRAVQQRRIERENENSQTGSKGIAGFSGSKRKIATIEKSNVIRKRVSRIVAVSEPSWRARRTARMDFRFLVT